MCAFLLVLVAVTSVPCYGSVIVPLPLLGLARGSALPMGRARLLVFKQIDNLKLAN